MLLAMGRPVCCTEPIGLMMTVQWVRVAELRTSKSFATGFHFCESQSKEGECVTRQDKAILIDRVTEILEAYLMDENEAYAECTLKFLKLNGETQEKVLHWTHPDVAAQIEPKTYSLIELLTMDAAERYEADSYYWNRAIEIVSDRTHERG